MAENQKTDKGNWTISRENCVNEDGKSVQSPVRISSVDQVVIEAADIVNRLEHVMEEEDISDSNGNDEHERSAVVPFEKRGISEIVNILRRYVKSSCGGSSDEDADGLALQFNETTKFTLIMHTLVAYYSSLRGSSITKLCLRITADTNCWLAQLFGCSNAAIYHHDDPLDGLRCITRALIHRKYPEFAQVGALSFAKTRPAIYSSARNCANTVLEMCSDIGVPVSCIRGVPVGATGTVDVTALQKMLADDVSAGKYVPLIVIADAGLPQSGHVDNVVRIRELCRLYNCWLHLRGDGLAVLAIVNYQMPGQEVTMSVADSYTLPLGKWLGVPKLPIITIYRLWEEINELILSGQRDEYKCHRRLSVLPLWSCLQCFGRNGISAHIMRHFLACEQVWNALNRYRHLRILSKKPAVLNTTNQSLTDVITKTIQIPVLFDETVCCVSFQFVPDNEETLQQNLIINDGDVIDVIPSYYDRLNAWLAQILQIDLPHMSFELCTTDVGTVILFCPFSGGNAVLTTDDIQSFIDYLEQQLVILCATVLHRETFTRLVHDSSVLRAVDLPDWAGLGGVRYVPDGWEQLLTDKTKDELNAINMRLVETLRTTDAAFSLGEDAHSGLLCVRFGMLTPQSDVEELLSLVVRAGQAMEENSRMLDSMAVIVQRGIQTATLDLQRENEERLWQEGILRQVPVVGALVNWWSPLNKDSSIRGRSLNLTQGIVESTENIYRYHMQAVHSGSGGKIPSAPQVQLDVSSQHSRSSSHASSSQISGIALDDVLKTPQI